MERLASRVDHVDHSSTVFVLKRVALEEDGSADDFVRLVRW